MTLTDYIQIANVIALVGIPLVFWLVRNWVESKISSAVNLAASKQLEDYRADRDRRNQSQKIAEYLSYASNISDDVDDEYFRKCNQLAWELFLWLPPEIYRSVINSFKPGGNFTEALLLTRRHLLQADDAELGPGDMIRHAKSVQIEELEAKASS